MNNDFDNFIRHYSSSFQMDDPGKSELQKHLSIVEFKKETTLVRENQHHDFVYYVIKGAIRSYYGKDGIEINTWFAFENEIVGSFQNYQNKPSRETLQLVENSKLIAVNLRTLKPLLNSHIQISNFIRAIIDEYAQFLEDRLYATQFMSSMERYVHLLENEPRILQRIPLTCIASYLGISRETLSRLRGK